MTPPTIDVRGLRRTYGTRTALDGIDLTVAAGSLTALIGPNGSGKTTTLRILLGLERPDGGGGTVLGEPLDRPGHYLPRVGALVEEPALYRRLTGRANLRVLAELAGTPVRRIDEVLELTGLTSEADRPVRGYSLGMRQRLGLAAALLPDPRLLVLDEPTNGLDPLGVTQLRGLLSSLAECGVTVLISSHHLGEVDVTCDTFVLLQRGRVLFAGDRTALTATRCPMIELAPGPAHNVTGLEHLLTSLGHRPRRENGLLLVEAPAATAPGLNRAAAAEGITLAHLAVHRPTVEQAFLHLLSREPAPAAAPC